MNEHPLYDRPESDKGREKRTADWNKTDIVDFLEDRFDDPREEFGVETYEQLEERIEELGLSYDGESDWRHDQVKDLGDRNFDYSISCLLMRLEDVEERDSKPDDYVPAKVSFMDEDGDVQVKFEK